ncbi:MAG: hypothetical protein ABI981_14270 [Betaproteobacteria bacterium]
MTTTPRPDRRKGRRILLLMALFAVSPIIASYVTYFWFTPDKRVNYGELLGTAAAPPIDGVREGGAPFALADLRGQWVLMVVTRDACSEACRQALYATRQARTIQGREQDRVARVWLSPADAAAPPDDLVRSHPGLSIARAPPQSLARLPLLPRVGLEWQPTILLMDPRGNLVLRYRADADIKRLASDLGRLLRASQIGEAAEPEMLKYATDSCAGCGRGCTAASAPPCGAV